MKPPQAWHPEIEVASGRAAAGGLGSEAPPPKGARGGGTNTEVVAFFTTEVPVSGGGAAELEAATSTGPDFRVSGAAKGGAITPVFLAAGGTTPVFSEPIMPVGGLTMAPVFGFTSGVVVVTGPVFGLNSAPVGGLETAPVGGFTSAPVLGRIAPVSGADLTRASVDRPPSSGWVTAAWVAADEGRSTKRRVAVGRFGIIGSAFPSGPTGRPGAAITPDELSLSSGCGAIGAGTRTSGGLATVADAAFRSTGAVIARWAVGLVTGIAGGTSGSLTVASGSAEIFGNVPVMGSAGGCEE